MDAVIDSPKTSTITCRRCGRPYVLRRTFLPACPHCGKSPQPLYLKLQHNGLAAVMCVLALGVLSWAINTPFISMNKLGEVRIYSLLGGIWTLLDDGQYLIGGVLLLFSVVFPYAKLLAILIATSSLVPIRLKARRRLHWLASITGKYSLLDVLVVAIIIVVARFQNLTDAKPLMGTSLFCVAVVLSIVAGWAVNLDESQAKTELATDGEPMNTDESKT